jgi:histidine triad (HIT) family protein
VIPKKEVDYLFDLDDNTLKDIMVFAKKIAKAIQKCMPCQRIGVAVLGLEVPHAHIHLVPLQTEADINFANPKLKLNGEEMNDIAKKIRTELNKKQ